MILMAGDEILVHPRGLVVIEAIEDSVLLVESTNH